MRLGFLFAQFQLELRPRKGFSEHYTIIEVCAYCADFACGSMGCRRPELEYVGLRFSFIYNKVLVQAYRLEGLVLTYYY